MEIKIITSSDPLWEQVAAYAEACSWRAGKFLAGQMRHGGFREWERVLAAVESGKIAGYCTVCEKDCIPDLPYTPFICSLFVGEPYRGNRLSQRLIEAAMEYIRSLGFDAAYLFSDHVRKVWLCRDRKVSSPSGRDAEALLQKLASHKFICVRAAHRLTNRGGAFYSSFNFSKFPYLPGRAYSVITVFFLGLSAYTLTGDAR